MRSTFNRLLTILAVFDLTFLIFCFVEESLTVVYSVANGIHEHQASPAWVVLYPFLLHPMQQIYHTASVYTTVAVSVER